MSTLVVLDPYHMAYILKNLPESVLSDRKDQIRSFLGRWRYRESRDVSDFKKHGNLQRHFALVVNNNMLTMAKGCCAWSEATHIRNTETVKRSCECFEERQSQTTNLKIHKASTSKKFARPFSDLACIRSGNVSPRNHDQIIQQVTALSLIILQFLILMIT